MIRPASKIVTNFRTRDPKDWQPLHNFIQLKNDILSTSKNQTTRKASSKASRKELIASNLL